MNIVPSLFGSLVDRGTVESLNERMSVACSALGTVTEALKTCRGDDEDKSIPGVHPLDGGLTAAFDSTVIRLLDRIETIAVSDPAWKETREARRLRRKEAVDRVSLIAEAAKHTRDSARPSHKYRVELVYLDNSNFMAFLRLKDGSALAGFGESAAEAMVDFDRAWYRKRPDFTPIPDVEPAIVGAAPPMAGDTEEGDTEEGDDSEGETPVETSDKSE